MAAPDAPADGRTEAFRGKGASSRTPSLRSSIHLVRPVDRGWRVKGRVISAVSCVGYLRRSALRACRN